MKPVRSDDITVLLVDPLPARAKRLSEAIERDSRFNLIAACRSLTEAYSPTEAEQPDVVVIGAELAGMPEYPMYAAMLDMLDLDRLIVANAGQRFLPFDDHDRIATEEEIAGAGGIARFIAAQKGLAPPAGGDPSGARPAGPAEFGRLVVIGASTGGIEALIAVLAAYPANCPPTMIVQHIGADFVAGLVRRLDRHCAARVSEAQHNLQVRPGQVVVAPGRDCHLTVAAGNLARLLPGPPISGHRPSVDALFQSAARAGAGVVGAILTGMGRDGAEGLAAIRRAGGWTIGQDQTTSTVYGMPRVARELGGVAEQLPLGRIGPAILKAAALPAGQGA